MKKVCLTVPVLVILAGCAEIPAKPVVRGEKSAGHHRPSWTWKPGGSVPATTKYRFRLDAGPWITSKETSYTPTTDLVQGDHLFEIQAGTAENRWSPTVRFSTTIEFFHRPGYWTGIERNPARTQLDHEVVLVNHNTYQDCLGTQKKNLTSTLENIHDAQENDADAIELDIVSWNNILRVTHDDNGRAEKAAKLSDVLSDTGLRKGSQLLFLELKEKQPSAKKIRLLLNLLMEHGYGTNGRPVVIRSFATDHRKKNLTLLDTVLKETDYIHIRSYIRRHAILGEEGTQEMIGKLYDSDIDGVEIKSTKENLFGMLIYARSLGMGTGIWSLDNEQNISAFREEVDAIVVDLPVNQAREVIQKKNSLLHMNVWNGYAQDKKIEYWKKGNRTSLSANSLHFPDFEWLGPGEDRFGGSLILNRSRKNAIGFGDLENLSGKGLLVSMVVNFDDLSPRDGKTHGLLAKTDSSGYGLELYNPPGWFHPTVLRFVVHVNGQYRYAIRTIGDLNETDSYHIVAAYNGSGKIDLQVNGSSDHVISEQTFGGITRNNSPLTLGADPQGGTSRRHHFSGKIQQVQVQRW